MVPEAEPTVSYAIVVLCRYMNESMYVILTLSFRLLHVLDYMNTPDHASRDTILTLPSSLMLLTL